MVSVPTIRTYKNYPDPESILDYREWGESLFDTMEFLMRPPIVHLQASSSQTYLNATGMSVSFNKVVVDTHGFFNPTTPTRITPNVPGWYKGWIGFSYAPAATATAGRRLLFLSQMPANINLVRRDHRGVLNAAEEQIIKGVRFFAKSDGTTQYFEMRQIQDSGGT